MDDVMFYIQQGFFHVLDWNALDHVLFFIALAIIYRFKNWKKALWLITFFTIAHSLTFGLSAYDVITIDVNMVEFLIPLTILIPLILNIYNSFLHKEISSKQLDINSYFAFFFGLIHGLGFSNYFKMLLDDSDDKLFPLLQFAVGIEFAQISIVVLVLVLNYVMLSILKVKKTFWVIAISFLVILYIIPMLIERFPF